ncbi:MAG: AIR synthase-related protein, partial [Planctomycetota bacterium]
TLDAERTIGDVLLEPTRLYADAIVRLQRRYRVKKVVSAMAHITGGGLTQNLERSLPDTVNAQIQRKALPTSAVFEWLQRHGRVDADEMARVFNMGVGYVLVVRPSFADSIADQLTRAGETVYRLGRITKGTGKVVVKGGGK